MGAKMDTSKYDFGAWATKNDTLCADGRIIRRDAFKECDGKIVPLLWNHDHDDPYAVMGHALLENRDDGVYAYLSFNDTDAGKQGKTLAEHGDVKSVSIYANKLVQKGSDVMHGIIREVSLVLAGANPEAYIDAVLAHSDDLEEATVVYLPEEDNEIVHVAHEENDMNEMTHDAEVVEEDSVTTDGMAEEENNKDLQHDDDESSEETVEQWLNSLSEKDRTIVTGLVGLAVNNAKEEEENMVKHNLFEGEVDNTAELIHSALDTIWKDSKRLGSLQESFLQHADEVQQYGIDHLEYFQKPEGTDIYNTPQFIKRQPDGWVDKVLSGVHKTPFSKIRMMFADITEDEARAKGYIKGKIKKDEFFKLIKRTVSPTTVYKKQKFDRDDIADADFDLIPWVKSEMDLMLNEELARAYLFGDGRSNSDDDKIDEGKIIPVVAEADLFAIKVEVQPAEGESLEHALINTTVLAQDDYRGSGSITGFFETGKVSKMLLMEDGFGHRLYKTVAELASAMNLSEIVRIPKGIMPSGIYGVCLDLRDYNVGLKDLGKKSWYDDFDIDFNQMKYLLETRQSGALIRPYSAIVLKEAQG